MVKAIDEEWSNFEWEQEFFDFLGPEYWFYKQQAMIENVIEELTRSTL